MTDDKMTQPEKDAPETAVNGQETLQDATVVKPPTNGQEVVPDEMRPEEMLMEETAVDGQEPTTNLLPPEIAGLPDEMAISEETPAPIVNLETEPVLELQPEPEPEPILEQLPEQFVVPKAVMPKPVPEGASLGDESLYFNMELSWVDFNWRVLHLALDERVPLLERVRFVAITASNLDEFVQKRVGGLKMQEKAGVRTLTPDGRTPTEQLDLIRDALDVMAETMTSTWESELRPAIKEQLNVHICNYDELDESQKERLHRHFQTQIYPILTPLTVDPGHPFPFISNLSLSLAVILRHPKRDTTHFARLKMPPQRWVQVENNDPEGSLLFLPVEQLIINHIDELFSGMEVVSANTFRITRNADISRDEEEADDLLSLISSELRARQFSSVVRLEVEKSMPLGVRRLLMRELKMDPVDLYEVDGMLDLTGCFKIADLEFPEHRFEPWEPVVPKEVQLEGFTKDTRDIFAIIRNGDLLVHHPYESFTASVLRLIEEAAADDRVVAIKQTLYRTSHESPIVQALVNAAEKGKQVAVLVEVKARFDEANNIEWAQMLENHGVHVTYGLVGLKTHTKATLIIRQDRDRLRTYCHIGTGNYHPKTARLYTDLGLFTCKPELGRDLVNLFHFLTGYAPDQVYEKVLVAPRTMRKMFDELIQQEVEIQENGGNGRIIAKMNALDDVGIIKQLYKASQAGVQIDLILRGHSRLRPQIPGYSDNIRIISILGRFLEHDRIFYFHNNDDPKIYIGSADWRRRNLKSRVELITPVEEPELQKRIIQILEDALSDNYLAWDLDAEGQYTLRRPGEDSVNNFHKILMKSALKRAKKARIKNAYAR